MFTFKEFLNELMEPGIDPEDLGADDLKMRARAMMKQAQLKSTGKNDQATALNLKALKKEYQTATDPRQKADLQRRIKELMSGPDPEKENAAI